MPQRNCRSCCVQLAGRGVAKRSTWYLKGSCRWYCLVAEILHHLASTVESPINWCNWYKISAINSSTLAKFDMKTQKWWFPTSQRILGGSCSNSRLNFRLINGVYLVRSNVMPNLFWKKNKWYLSTTNYRRLHLMYIFTHLDGLLIQDFGAFVARLRGSGMDTKVERLAWEAGRDEILKGSCRKQLFFWRCQVRKIDIYCIFYAISYNYTYTLYCTCITMYQNCGATIKMVVVQYWFLSNTCSQAGVFYNTGLSFGWVVPRVVMKALFT